MSQMLFPQFAYDKNEKKWLSACTKMSKNKGDRPSSRCPNV